MTCFYLCTDVETLAQRVAKRARASSGGQPPAGTSSTPLVVESSPAAAPSVRSPLTPHQCVLGYDPLELTLPWLQEEDDSRRNH